jgi:hypothetical protein
LKRNKKLQIGENNIEILFMTMVLGKKKTLKKQRSKIKPFHASLFKNILKNSSGILELSSKRMIYGTQSFLPKPIPMNHHH